MINVKMDKKGEHRLCMFCNNVAKIEFETKVVLQLFNVIFLESDLVLTGQLVICHQCLETAKKCLQFKVSCINSEKNILVSTTRKRQANFGAKDSCGESERFKTSDGCAQTCRFCLAPLKQNNPASLDAVVDKSMLQMLPEMDFNITKNPMVCMSCKDDLETYLKFIKVGLLTKADTNFEDATCSLDQTKTVDDICQNANERPATEPNILKAMDDTAAVNGELNTIESISSVNVDVYADKDSSRENGNDQKARDDTKQMPLTKSATVTKTFECSQCSFKTSRRYALKRHLLTHTDILETETFQCGSCSFKTKYKYSLKSHTSTHNCDVKKTDGKCSKSRIETAKKAVPEAKVFKCSLCQFKTNRRYCLKRHLVIHKDISEINPFECTLCSFKTKYRNSLKYHMSTHDVDTKTVYDCSSCAFKTDSKLNLSRHLLIIHKDVSVETFKCSVCSVETMCKYDLKKHMRLHQDISQIKMFECSACSYKTDRNYDLKKHVSTRHNEENETYKCAKCDFETKYKCNLIKHVSGHKGGPEVEFFEFVDAPEENKEVHRCLFCSFTTRRKFSLREHSRVHVFVAETGVYQCLYCAFKTNHRRSLTRHMARHIDVQPNSTSVS